MHQTQVSAEDRAAIAAAIKACGWRPSIPGCPVGERVDTGGAEAARHDTSENTVEMAVDGAQIGLRCERGCPAVEPLLNTMGRVAAAEALTDDADGGQQSPALRRLNRLPTDASEPARHAFLLVKAAYRLRQARTADALWKAVDANLGCWIALRAAISGDRIGLSAARRHQIIQYADYVERMTHVTRPMSDRLVEAFIRLDRNVAKWLTEEAADHVAAEGDDVLMAAE